MRRQLWRIWGLGLALYAMFLLQTAAHAATNGSCGQNVTWTLDNTGVLTLQGRGAMDDYVNRNAVPWAAYRSQIQIVTVEESVTSIGRNAFNACPNLMEVTLAETVRSIGDYAFSECPFLTDIDFGQGVRRIEDNAFSGCSELSGVVLPENLIYIGQYAFSSCAALKEIRVPNGVSEIKSGTFFKCVNLERITLPDGLTAIGHRAFSSCSAIASVLIPQTVTLIYDFAFENCTSLRDIYYTGNQTRWARINISRDDLTQFFQQIQDEAIIVHLNWTGESVDLPAFSTEIRSVVVDGEHIAVEVAGEAGVTLFVAAYGSAGKFLGVRARYLDAAGTFIISMDMDGVQSVKAFALDETGRPMAESFHQAMR